MLQLIFLLQLAKAATAYAECPVAALFLSRRVSPPPLDGHNGVSALHASTPRDCCSACQAASCASFSWRPEDGTCLLHDAFSSFSSVADNAPAAAWWSAPLAQPHAGACSAAAVASGASAASFLRMLRSEASALSDQLLRFWLAHGPDAAAGDGRWHTTLDSSGRPAAPAALSLREQAEDCEAMSRAAARMHRLSPSSALTGRTWAAADAVCGFVLRAASVNSSDSTDRLFTTHAAIVSALAAHSQALREAGDSRGAAAALAGARAAADALLACCSLGGGGFSPRPEVALGWFPAGAVVTLPSHVAAIAAFNALRNASAAAPSGPAAPAKRVATAQPDGRPSDPLAGLLDVTASRILPAAADALPTYYNGNWAAVAAGGGAGAAPGQPAEPPAVEYGTTLALFGSLASARAPPATLARAAAAARAASQVGYDSETGGYLEKGIGGAPVLGAAGPVMTYHTQLSSLGGLLALWRATGERVHLCRALSTLSRLRRHQLAPAGELYWSVIDPGPSERNASATPVGMHGSRLAEPWKGAGPVSLLALLSDQLDEISTVEAAAEDARPQPAADAGWDARAGGAAAATRAAPRPLPAGALDVRVLDGDSKCEAACEALQSCGARAFDSNALLCLLLKDDSPADGWDVRPLRRAPLAAAPLGACPASLPALHMSLPVTALAGWAGKGGSDGGEARTAVRLRAASCERASDEVLAGAKLRGCVLSAPAGTSLQH